MNDFLNNVVLDKKVYIVDSEYMYSFEDLRDSLINEVKRDTIENREDKDIVESNLKLLEKIYNIRSGYEEKFVIEELKAFGYSILKVNDLIRDLIDLKAYWNNFENCEIQNNVKKVEDLINEIKIHFNN